MKRNIKTIGSFILFGSVISCAFFLLMDKCSFAETGVNVYTEKPCVVVNVDCPVCGRLDESFTAYYNMAGQTIFTLEGPGEGSFVQNGSIELTCYLEANCKVCTYDESLSCRADGCVFTPLHVTGCKSFVQQAWVRRYNTYPLWREAEVE